MRHTNCVPYTVVQGNLELLRRQAALTKTEREAGRMVRMVADLLTLARADAGILLKRQHFELDVITLEAFHTARQLAHS